MANLLEFTKAQAVGNDFLIVQVDDVGAMSDGASISVKLCNRKLGAGADGVVFVSRSTEPNADFDSRIFNADGTEAEVSGNGTRCLAAYLYQKGLQDRPAISIRTLAGIKRGRLVSKSGSRFEFEFDMGRPVLSSADIPVSVAPDLRQVIAYDLEVAGKSLKITCTSMGNPHCSIFVDHLDEAEIDRIGPLIERHPLFPNRTNVEVIKRISDAEIEVRFWERGVGRTLSSGTGSCAASVAAVLNGLTSRKLKVRTLGGVLGVSWLPDDSVALTGHAEMIFEGRWLACY